MSTESDNLLFYNKIVKSFYPLGLKDEAILIFKNAIPLALSILSQQLLSMMSFFFCGHVGQNELAAVSLANTLIHIGSFGPILGLSSACETLIPQLYAGNDKKKVGIVVQRGIIMSLICAFFCIGFLLNSKYIMRFFVHDEVVLMLADTFLFYFSPSILFFSVQIIISKYLQSQNIFYPILFINVFSNILNAGLQWILVIWLKNGVIGSAISVVLANIFQLVILILYIIMSKVHKPTWPGFSYECMYDWKLYLKLGIAGFGMVVFEWSSFEIAVMSAGLLGNFYLSAMSITQQTVLTFILIHCGISSSGNIRIGQLLGENQPEKALNSVKVVFTVTGLCSICMGIIIFTFSGYIPIIFTNEDDLIEQVSSTLELLAFVHFFDAMQVCGAGVLRAIGAQVYGVVVSFISYYLIGLSFGLYLLLGTPLKVKGFWTGFLCAAIFLLVSQVFYLYKVDWKKQAQIANQRALKMKHDISNKDSEVSTQTSDALNLKRKIIKKLLVFGFVIVVFSFSVITRQIFSFKIGSNFNSTNITVET